MIKISIAKHIYRNFETNELGCWAHLEMKLPYAPFIGLLIHDGKGEIMEVKLIKFDRTDNITYCLVESEPHTDYEYAKKVANDWDGKLEKSLQENL